MFVVILLAVYALGVWAIAWRYRRRWQAFCAILAGAPPVLLSARLDVWLIERLIGEDAGYLFIIGIVFASVIVLIGLLLALQPRGHPAHACQGCGYDLRGISPTVCPECGVDPESEELLRRPTAPHPQRPLQPVGSVAGALVDSRRARSRASSTLSRVTTAAPASAASPTRTM